MARSLGLVVCLAAASGCFAMDEIDSGMKYYDKHRNATRGDAMNSGQAPPGAPPAPGQPAEAPAAPAADGKPAPPSGAAWWAKARTLGSEPGNEKISGCQLGGRLEFMLRDDCLARGGTPQ
jgi:hypothetical protein